MVRAQRRPRSSLRSRVVVCGPCSPCDIVLESLLGVVIAAEEVLEVSLGCIQEVAGDTVVLRLAVGDLANGIAVQAEQDRARVTEDDGGVRRDEELGVPGRLELV